MRMKRIILAVLAGLFLTLSMQGAGWAHPPKQLDLVYRAAEGELVVTAYHGVKDTAKHYVEKVVVYAAGEKVIDESFTSQTTRDSLVVTFPVGALAPGTEVRVEARCNIFGTRKGTLIIP